MTESLPDSTQIGGTPNSGADAPTARGSHHTTAEST